MESKIQKNAVENQEIESVDSLISSSVCQS